MKSYFSELKIQFNDFLSLIKKLLLLILFSLSSFLTLNAQWEKCNTGLPICEGVNFIINGNNTYAGIECGVYLTTNNGDNWIPKNNGLTNINLKSGLSLNSIAFDGNNIFVGTTLNGIFLSTDKGENWVRKSNGLPYDTNSSIYLGGVNTIVINGNNVFAGTSWGVSVSTDNGDNWKEKNNGLPQIDSAYMNIYSFIISRNNIFAGTSMSGIFLSTNNGYNWVPKNNGLTNLNIWSLAINGNKIFAGTDDGLFLSTDNGNNWKFIAFKGYIIYTFFIKGNYIFIGSFGVYMSTDNGKSWIDLNSGLPDIISISSIIINGNYIFAGTGGHGVYRAKLSDFGITNIDVKETYQNNESIIFPNPASSSVRLKYESSSFSKLQISIFDLLGNEVFNTSEDCNIGMNEKEIDCHSLETGYYIIRLKQGVRVEAKPFQLIKN